MEKYGNYLVQCPMPGMQDLPPERLGDFMQTEVGKKVLGQALENVDFLIQAGIDEERAVTIALGPAAVHDEAGKPMKAKIVETAHSAADLQTVDSKKK